MTFGRGLFVVVSLALFGLAVRWVVVAPPQFWVSGVALGAYLGLIVAGVMTPRLQMFGPALCSVPAAKNQLALTFDDGPDPTSTPIVLDALRRAGARATFFLVGHKVEKYPELALRLVREGHELGAHSYDHNRMYAFLSASEVASDIERTCRVIAAATGVTPKWFRPPVGQMSPPTALGIERSGLMVAGWSVRSLDGLPHTTVETVRRRVEPRLRAGAIVLLHDAPERESAGSTPPAGARALPELLEVCRGRGLRCVSLSELARAQAAEPWRAAFPK